MTEILLPELHLIKKKVLQRPGNPIAAGIKVSLNYVRMSRRELEKAILKTIDKGVCVVLYYFEQDNKTPYLLELVDNATYQGLETLKFHFPGNDTMCLAFDTPIPPEIRDRLPDPDWYPDIIYTVAAYVNTEPVFYEFRKVKLLENLGHYWEVI